MGALLLEGVSQRITWGSATASGKTDGGSGDKWGRCLIKVTISGNQ
jgi:hypothetical protein